MEEKCEKIIGIAEKYLGQLITHSQVRFPYEEIVEIKRLAEEQKIANKAHKGMILNEEQRKEFEQVVRPLIKWLNDNYHPHVTVVADCSSAELSEGVNSFVTEDYWKD